jgi:hypothetical protein
MYDPQTLRRRMGGGALERHRRLQIRAAHAQVGAGRYLATLGRDARQRAGILAKSWTERPTPSLSH